MGSDDESDKFDPLKVNRIKDAENNGENDKDDKQSNTIIQQINGFSMTPMTDRLAEQTIEDHKYLLELVENRAAIAYFAVFNRNSSLFGALKNYQKTELEAIQNEENDIDSTNSKGKKETTKEQKMMDEICNRIIIKYEFITLVMYPEIQSRKDFVHDCWLIAKLSENAELKISIADDPYFQVNRSDILNMLKTKDD